MTSASGAVGSVVNLGLLIAGCHALALLLLLGTAATRGLAALGAWLAPIVAAYLLSLRAFGVLRPSASLRDGQTALRIAAASASAAALLTAVVIAIGRDKSLPLTAVILGGALIALALLFVRLRSVRPNLLLASFSGLLALAFAEGFLAFVHDPLDPKRFVPSTPYARYRELLIADDRLGFRLRPNSHVVFRREDVDYYRMDVRVNSFGIRDREYARAKPLGVKRVVFVGDSIVFGAGIELEQSLAKRLEASLNKTDAGARFEVMNWGVGSYCLSQELGLLREADAAGFEPDLILVGTGPNDFGQSLKPNTFRGETGLLATEETQQRFAGARHGLQRLRSDRLLRFWLQKLLPGTPPRGAEQLAASAEARATRAELSAFRDYARSHGVPLAVVLFPGERLIDPAGGGEERLVYELMGRELAALEVPYRDCLPALREGTRKLGRLFVPWDSIHFNAQGSGVIAEDLSGFVQAALKRRQDD